MTETTTCCSRCGNTIEGMPIGVEVDGGQMHSGDPVLSICPDCAGSLARWLGRGRHRAASSKPMVQEPKEDAEDQPRHRKHRSRGDRRRQQQTKALLRNIALLTLLIVVNALVVIMVIKFVNSPTE